MEKNEENSYDVAVIGAGCMGSACARHLAECYKGMKVCLIGPDEPTLPRSQSGRSVFAAYYDQGRITRRLDADPVWSRIADRSISRYPHLQESTGIQYYSEVGSIIIGPKQDIIWGKIEKCAKDLQINYNRLNNKDLKSRFPYLHLADDYIGFYEANSAGYISPRGQVKAEIKAAMDNGCQLIRDIVYQVQRSQDGKFIITTESNRVISSQKIVVATGAFTLFKDIIPTDIRKKLAITCGTQTVVKLQVSEEELKDYTGMPCILHRNSSQQNGDWYLLPPILYPNGKYYIKIGHSKDFIREINNYEHVLEWFHGTGDIEAKNTLVDIINHFLPHFKPVSIESDCCAYTLTPHNHVMIGNIAEGMVLLTGGNGHAAKSADELGRIGALTIMNESWNYDISSEEFKLCLNSS
ncbi:N-methyl-L-tryptophan oxidase [Trichoplax sp. H2]|nr:N-methyl-L-tryptophan oxidase [Trichoplax sp. H2]|eukprot:RDD36956.1 N-methyl-L-tryptophan oxidase [Trichoplax sp. H2]